MYGCIWQNQTRSQRILSMQMFEYKRISKHYTYLYGIFTKIVSMWHKYGIRKYEKSENVTGKSKLNNNSIDGNTRAEKCEGKKTSCALSKLIFCECFSSSGKRGLFTFQMITLH